MGQVARAELKTMTESLGPKPTAKQMETLKRLCESDVEVHFGVGTRLDGDFCYMKVEGKSGYENFRIDVLDKFKRWGWLEPIEPPTWRGGDYRVSEKGRKVVELGVIRK